MTKKHIAVIGIFLSALLIFTVFITKKSEAEATANETSFYSFTDSIGNKVELKEKPQRVAVLFSSLCNAWKNAGGEALISVGESVERGFCEKDALLVDSGAGKSINAELLLSYEPDFVIYSSDIPAQRKVGELLIKSGIPAAAIRLDSFEDYLSALEIFCSITEKKENYTLYGENPEKKIALIKAQAKEKSDSPKLLFIRSGASISSFKAKTSEENFTAKMLTELGAENIADSVPLILDGISAEAILKENPDFIFVSVMGDEEAGRAFVEKEFSSGMYKTLRSKIIFLPKDLFQYKPCEKWAEAYSFLWETLNNS